MGGPKLVQQGLGGRPLTVYGNGRQTRCFAFVGDVVESLLRLMDHPDTPGEVFNIGSTEEVSITQLAERILSLTGSDSEIIYVPYNVAYEEGFEDMPRRVPDTSKAQRFIGSRPCTSLDEILGEVIRYRSSPRGAEAVDLVECIE